MRGEILGPVAGAIHGAILPRGASTTTLLWSIAGTTQITEEAADATYTVSYVNAMAPGQSATIAVASAAGAAADGLDYTGAATTLTFTAGGATAKTLAVTIIEDTIVEGAEDFRVTLASPSVGQLATSQATTSIADEDASLLAWSISGPTSVDEGDAGTYTVGYTGATLAPGQQATVTVATASGALSWPDASAGSDYTALSTVLTFTGGGATAKTVAVSTIDDTDVEGTEDFRVTIGGVSGGSLAVSQANTAIADGDDAAYETDAVRLSGLESIHRGADFTAISDDDSFVFSIWLRKDLDGVQQYLAATLGNPNFRLFINSSNNVVVFGQTSASVTVLNATTSATIVADGLWHHLLVAADLAQSKLTVHLDDVDVTPSSPTFGAGDIDFTRGNFFFLARTGTLDRFTGDVADLWFTASQFLDFSVMENRRKFMDASGKPVFLGNSGELPTGMSPILFMHLDAGELPVSNFAANAGTGGGMTIGGTLLAAATSPSD